ncbi:hypothetical protein [Thiohalomonas denitrificans]|uniref:hypothetical protein n=1 Tax=Thiohalomonas denitrificans TaxID=415747 RepID=UPI0026EFDE97|nr:hypothetical protein [Thiohalomonas denitrificans]
MRNLDAFDEFVKAIEPQLQQYTVVFCASKTGKLITKNANEKFVSYSESFVTRLENDPNEGKFASEAKETDLFLTFGNIEERDPVSAREVLKQDSKWHHRS